MKIGWVALADMGQPMLTVVGALSLRGDPGLRDSDKSVRSLQCSLSPECGTQCDLLYGLSTMRDCTLEL